MKNVISVGLSLLLSAIVATPLYAQKDGDIFKKQTGPYIKNGTGQKALGWAGGFNNPQFALGDINQDGTQDLVIYEHGFGVKTFVGNGAGGYIYRPEFENNFPDNITGYLKLIDYNGDMVPDLVHRGSTGFAIHKGYYDNKQLKFTFYRNLYYNSTVTGLTNAYVEPNTDIPIVIDIDKDGDVDFLSYEFSGSRISYYRNCRIEDGLPPDSIRICLKDLCWGRTNQPYDRTHFLGSLCTSKQNTFSTCKGCPPPSGQKPTHVGNTLCAFDSDGDGDYDVLNGNISFPDVQYFQNGKVDYGLGLLDSMISQDTIWDSNGVEAITKNFPAAFWLDIDADGDNDIIISPHEELTENYKSALFYENEGTNANPNFIYKTDEYLVRDMIDLGSGAYPTLYDYDKDGKLDLFIGSDGFYQSNGTYKSKVAYYKNTSTGTTTSFEMVTDDFLNLEAMNFVGMALAFGDIDGDTLDDMVIGKTDGTLALYLNTATSSTVQPVWTLYQQAITLLGAISPFDAGDFAAPCIYDIDKDGDNDIIVGNQLGDLIHLKNNGSTSGNIAFLKGSDNLGGVKINEKGQVYGYSAPYIGPIDNTGIDYLMVGTNNGHVFRFDGFQSGNITTPFTRIDSLYSYVSVHNRAVPTFGNIDNSSDGLYEMIVGNFLGGVNYYRQTAPVSVNDVLNGNMADVKVYPNPTKDILNITWGTDFAKARTVSVKVVSITGQTLVSKEYGAEEKTGQLSVSNLPSGMYYCIVVASGNKTVKPVVIVR
ncbi:MAG: T9SS type A sorting domain-containing protein [Flavipsychrobacter sp.]